MVEELLSVVVVLVVAAERGDVVVAFVVVDYHWNYSIQHWNKTETHPSPLQYSRHCSRPHLMPMMEMMMMTMTTRRKTTALA